MPRVRLGVALLVPPPFDIEVDAFRRAMGDGAYGRIPAHLTLVPPVNVSVARLSEALDLLRAAAVATREFTIEFGSPATFLPETPVLYLPVVDGREELVALRDRVFAEPLARPLTWPFVPHVTLADEALPERIAAARVALADYRARVAFDRVHVLQQGPDRRWSPIAEAIFGPAMVVGRGGLPLELSVTTVADPEAREFQAAGVAATTVVTGRRHGRVAGVASLELAPGEAQLGTAEHLAATLRHVVDQDG